MGRGVGEGQVVEVGRGLVREGVAEGGNGAKHAYFLCTGKVHSGFEG